MVLTCDPVSLTPCSHSGCTTDVHHIRHDGYLCDNGESAHFFCYTIKMWCLPTTLEYLCLCIKILSSISTVVPNVLCRTCSKYALQLKCVGAHTARLSGPWPPCAKMNHGFERDFLCDVSLAFGQHAACFMRCRSSVKILYSKRCSEVLGTQQLFTHICAVVRLGQDQTESTP